MSKEEQAKEIQDKIDAAALSECIYEPKYGGKDHSGYETMMKYEINGERVEAFSNGATFGYNLAQEEIERLKKFIEDTFWERHNRNYIPDAEAWQEFKTENNL